MQRSNAIEQEAITRALTLTALGGGAAIAALVILTIFVQATGLLIDLVQNWGERRRVVQPQETDAHAREREERALAAAIAVGALIAEPGRAGRSGIQISNNPS
ncbi:MAG: hypothetical protein O2854_02225 [Chloroflexi bacterium]|nr:hypothetical protein [Chloroflexota bacterium]